MTVRECDTVGPRLPPRTSRHHVRLTVIRSRASTVFKHSLVNAITSSHCIGTTLTMLPTGRVSCIPFRFPLHDGRSGPGIPIQYCTTDSFVKTRGHVHTVPRRVLLHDSAASPLSTSRPQMMYLFVKCSVQPFMFSLVRETRPSATRKTE